MDPNDLIKHVPDVMKGTAAVAGALKFTDMIKAMLGPATAEVAERVKDEIRLYRYGRQLKLLEKAEKMAKDAGFTPKAVPIKLLFPLLEGASLEEDEDLHTMWAALLVNASDPSERRRVTVSFPSVLSQITPDDARLISMLCSWIRSGLRNTGPLEATDVGYESEVLHHASVDLGFVKEHAILAMDGTLRGAGYTKPDNERFTLSMENLIRLRLLALYPHSMKNADAAKSYSVRWEDAVVCVTSFGREFVKACEAPK